MQEIKEKIKNYRLCRNGRSLPYGLGCAYIGRDMLDSARVTREIKLLDHCYEAGFRYFDTSCDYGDSEDLLGKWLPTAPRGELFLVSKGRYPYQEGHAKAIETLKRHFYSSFERLHVDHLDAYLIHDAEAYGAMEQEALPFLLERKKEGMIDYIGQGTRDVNAHMHAVLGGKMDMVLSYLQLNIVNLSAKPVAQKALQTGTAFINGTPLASELFLSPRLFKDYSRNRADIAFGEQMMALVRQMGIDPVAAALQFPIFHSDVDLTLNGISNDEELASSLRGLDAVIYPDQWARIFAMQRQYRYIDLQLEYMK